MIMQRLLIGTLTVMMVFFFSWAWADELLTAEQVNEYKSALSELLSESEDQATLKEIGKLYFQIGQKTHDRGSIKRAIDIFKRVLEKEPHDPEIAVYLGSAYTLKARDFPLKWLANITPLGFIRIYYVKKGLNIMDDAVKSDGMHPVVRLIRGMTRVSLPKGFLQFEKGMADLKQVLSWMEEPSLNENDAELLTDKAFLADATYMIGEVYLQHGEREKAFTLFKKVLSIASDTPLGEAARRRLDEKGVTPLGPSNSNDVKGE